MILDSSGSDWVILVGDKTLVVVLAEDFGFKMLSWELGTASDF